MQQVIGIIDYGVAGNIFNIVKTLNFLNENIKINIIDNDFSKLKDVDKIILPGVGAFKNTMDDLSDNLKILRYQIAKKPTLGICLGMQILSEKGFEFGETDGIKAIEGEVKKLFVHGSVPHIGWSGVEELKDSYILKHVDIEDKFYFMHSYELINFKDCVGLTNYCNHKFISVIEKDNIFGVQFHPEKSRESGFKIFNNFLRF